MSLAVYSKITTEEKMNAKEIQKRNGKAQQLRVLQTGDNEYYVQSSEGKILYSVITNNDGSMTCSCGDFARGIKQDPAFKCKHCFCVEASIPNGNAENAEFLEKMRPKLDERFIINIKGRDFVVYSGLLDLAHQKGLLKLNAEAIQYPTKENGNVAICRAVAELNTGEMFSDIGDAGPNNVTREIGNHVLRMASTRAKCRVLRDLTNIGMTSLEELGELTDVIGIGNNQKTRSNKVTPIKESKPAKPEPKKEEVTGKKEESKPETKKPSVTNIKSEPKTDDSNEDTAPKMSEAQKRAVMNLSRRRGLSVEDIEKMAVETYGVKIEFLSTSDASAFIRTLQQSA